MNRKKKRAIKDNRIQWVKDYHNSMQKEKKGDIQSEDKRNKRWRRLYFYKIPKEERRRRIGANDNRKEPTQSKFEEEFRGGIVLQGRI